MLQNNPLLVQPLEENPDDPLKFDHVVYVCLDAIDNIIAEQAERGAHAPLRQCPRLRDLRFSCEERRMCCRLRLHFADQQVSCADALQEAVMQQSDDADREGAISAANCARPAPTTISGTAATHCWALHPS